MNDERLEKLLDAHFDQALGEAERKELEYLLLSSAQARMTFWQRARFHALLRRYGMENWGAWLARNAETAALPPSAADSSLWLQFLDRIDRFRAWIKPNWRPTAVALACLVALFLILSAVVSRVPSPGVPDPLLVSALNSNPSIAELVRVAGVVWSNPARKLAPGSVLSPGVLKLDKGLIEVQFYRGARVVIEGPAHFELVSDMEARCLSGRIRVEVPPPAHGFKVLSPGLEVIDVGTSFGLNVQDNGHARLHVFQGKVEMASAASPGHLRSLTEGQSVLVSPGGQLEPAQTVDTDFVSLEEVEKRSRAEMLERYRQWQTFTSSLLNDPSLLLCYDFEDQSGESRSLLNRSHRATADSHGTIIGCRWTEGRWPGKAALDFKQFGDRVRFALPGSYQSITCMAWVRVDGLSHRLSALMMSGQARAGEPQWQLVQTGTVQFGKRILDGWGVDHMENCQTDVLIMPEQMGLWMHLALVYDLPGGSVRQYFNGQEVAASPINSPLPLTLDQMEIGNWTPQIGQPMEPIRNFNGRLDEFLVFGRTLTSREIQKLYEIGRQM